MYATTYYMLDQLAAAYCQHKHRVVNRLIGCLIRRRVPYGVIVELLERLEREATRAA